MGKQVPPHQWAVARKCIFCGNPGVSRTHIWPDWLSKMFPADARDEFREYRAPSSPTTEVKDLRSLKKQGNIFSQKPKLACVQCNNGWMNWFEDEISHLIRPALTGAAAVSLSRSQTQILAGWVCLITILIEFIQGHDRGILEKDRLYLRKHRCPTSNWSIFVAGITGPIWSRAYLHYPFRFYKADNAIELFTEARFIGSCNTQITSLGMGKLFFHIFSSPSLSWLQEFDLDASCRIQERCSVWRKASCV